MTPPEHKGWTASGQSALDAPALLLAIDAFCRRCLPVRDDRLGAYH
ncbi:MAG: hypothetical protein R2875_13760 [Desulfobacterales bacterium]